MNQYVELTQKPFYNDCAPRVRQAETRQRKGGYRPTGRRAAHDVQDHFTAWRKAKTKCLTPSTAC